MKMKNQKILLEVEEKILNRIVSCENPKILKKDQKFFFTGKYYSSEDEKIILKSTANTGKLFEPCI